MLGTDQIDTLWSAIFAFKKGFFYDRLQTKLDSIKNLNQDNTPEEIRIKEVEAVREVLSEFMIGVFADLDFISRSTLSGEQVDPFWERLSSHASANFKEWVAKTTYSINGEQWHGLEEIQANTDDFLQRAINYHSKVQKSTLPSS